MCHVATDWRRFREIWAINERRHQNENNNNNNDSVEGKHRTEKKGKVRFYFWHIVGCLAAHSPWTLWRAIHSIRRFPGKCISAHIRIYDPHSLFWVGRRFRLRSATYGMCFMDVHVGSFSIAIYPGWLLWCVRGTSHLHSISIALQPSTVFTYYHTPTVPRISSTFVHSYDRNRSVALVTFADATTTKVIYFQSYYRNKYGNRTHSHEKYK